MKSYLLSFIVIICYISIAKAQNCEVEYQFPKPFSDVLLHTYIVDTNNIIVVGFDSHSVYRTTNLGKDWTTIQVPIENGIMGPIAFKDKLHGYISGYTDDGRSVLNTNDGGLTWKNIQSPLQNSFWKMFFTSNNIGYATTGGWSYFNFYCSLYKTMNGGKNYYRQNQPCNAWSIYFSNDTVGWMLGISNENYFRLYKTLNGGNSWNRINNELTDTTTYWYPNGVNKYDDIHFFDQVGYINLNQKIYKTTDGGSHWLVMNTPTYYRANKMKVISKDTIIVNGWATEVATNKLYYFMKSIDGGNSWTLFQECTQDNDYEWLEDFDVYKNIIIGVGGASLITLSKDFGETSEIISEAPINWGVDFLNNFVFRTKMHGYFGYPEGYQGTPGGVLETKDGGKSWKRNSTINSECNSIQFIDTITGYLLTGHDLWKTNDGGINWEIKAHFDNYVAWMDIKSNGVGFVATYGNGYIYYTSDGGEHFTLQSHNDGDRIYSLKFNNGSLFKQVYNENEPFYGWKISEDKGITWVKYKPIAECDTFNLSFSKNPDIYYLSYCTFINWEQKYYYFKTIDNGIHWENLEFPDINLIAPTQLGGNLIPLNDSVCFLYNTYSESEARGLQILRTTDGCKTWTYFNTEDEVHYSSPQISPIDENTIYMNSWGGYIHKYTLNSNPWPKPDAVWYYSYNEGNNEGYIKIFPVKDTAIQGFRFSKLCKLRVFYNYLTAKIDTINDGYEYLCKDMDNLFIYRNNTINYLVKFNSSVDGAIWTCPATAIGCDQGPSYYLTSKEIIDINGHLREKVTFSNPNALVTPYLMGTTAIEDIGPVDAFLIPYPGYYCHTPDNVTWGNFRCYEDSEIGLYSANTAPYCDYTVSIGEEKANFSIRNFPNPADNFTMFDYKFPRGNYTLWLYSSIGILEKELSFSGEGNGFILNTNDLKAGLYLYKINVNGGNISGKLIVSH